MAKTLISHTHVLGEDGRAVHFAPGDTVPAWARKLLVNPKLWGDASEPTAPDPVTVEVPAKSGPGSGKEAWTAFAEARGVGLDSAMSRDDIMAACAAAGVTETAV